MNNKNNNLAKQDYRLVNARYKLTTNEIKFILFAISNLSDFTKDGKEIKYSIKVSEISEELESESIGQQHTRLKNFCEDIMKKPLYIPEKNGNFLVANWFSSLRYVKKEGKIEYTISTELLPYLLELKERFVVYNLKNILPLSSVYAIRIYQFLKEYEKLDKRVFSVEYLQDILQVPDSLKRYDNFKRRVLEVARKEINKHTDINFDYREIKTARKVTELEFLVKSKKKQ